MPIATAGQPEQEFICRRAAIAVADIQWDELNAERIRWYETQAALGKPFLQLDSGWRLNLPFWSRWLTQELGLNFDIVAQQLYRRIPASLDVEPLTQHETISLIKLAVQESVARASDKLLCDLDLPQVYALIEAVKLAAAFAPMTERENLNQYVHKRLQLPPRQMPPETSRNSVVRQLSGLVPWSVPCPRIRSW